MRERSKALLELKRAFKDSYAAGSADARRKTASALLAHYAAKKAKTPVDAYVVLDQARDQSTLGADLDGAFEAIDVLDRRFAVDGRALRLAAIEAVVPKARADERAATLELVARFASENVHAGALDVASKALKLAQALVETSKDASLAALLEPVLAKLRDVRALADAEAELAKDPKNPAANLAAGTLLCFERGEFDRGLRMLALAPPGPLRALAEADLASPAKHAEQTRLAQRWLEDARARSAGFHALRRARRWAALAWSTATADELGPSRRALEEICVALAAEPPSRAHATPIVSDPAELDELQRRALLAVAIPKGLVRDDGADHRERDLEIVLTSLDPASGRLAGALRWTDGEGDVLELAGEWAPGSDLLWFRAAPPASSTAATSTPWLFELRVPTSRVPRGAFEMKGAWRSGRRGGSVVLVGDYPELASIPSKLELDARLRPSPYGGRKLGGEATESTERAVIEGLRWLARHQAPDGSWRSLATAKPCSADASCFTSPGAAVPDLDVEVTALAVLAFLGCGYSHASEQVIVDLVTKQRFEVGPMIRRGLNWLAARQLDDGRFTQGPTRLESEAWAASALCEVNGVRAGVVWREPAQRALAFLASTQRSAEAGAMRGAWTAFADPPSNPTAPAAAALEFESSPAVTVQCLLALHAGAVSGLEVSQEALASGRAFIETTKEPDWTVAVEFAPPTELAKQAALFRKHKTSSALAMLARTFVTPNAKDPFLATAAKELLLDLPSAKDATSIDYDHWHEATLALHQYLGPKSPQSSPESWKRWNEAMKDALLGLQDTKEEVCSRGGWIQPDRRALLGGGPVYATAINVLTLETYYRYENEFAAGN